MLRLLIYIPTYNRPELLRKQLGLLEPQLRNNIRVRLIVADNASDSPESLTVLREFENQQWLSFIRRPANIQGNANILQGFLHVAKNEYLWILADDTEITSNAVEILISTIDQKAPDLIGLSLSSQKYLPETFSWSNQAVEVVTSEFSWGLISSAIYSGAFFSDSTYEGFLFHNSSFPHLGILLTALKRKGEVSLAWIPSELVHGSNFTDGPSDYSLAVAGFPQLFLLVDPRERKHLTIKWLKVYSAGFAHYGRLQPLAAAASLSILSEAGVYARLLIFFGWVESSIRRTRLGGRIERFILSKPGLLTVLQKSGRLMFKTRP